MGIRTFISTAWTGFVAFCSRPWGDPPHDAGQGYAVDFFQMELVRKRYTSDLEGNLYRVETRRDPVSGIRVRRSFEVRGAFS